MLFGLSWSRMGIAVQMKMESYFETSQEEVHKGAKYEAKYETKNNSGRAEWIII